MQIVVEIQSVWGKKRFYPLSEDAKTLTELLKKPTLTIDHLTICKKAGWVVEIHNKILDLDDFLI